jgi:hypothetical protein
MIPGGFAAGRQGHEGGQGGVGHEGPGPEKIDRPLHGPEVLRVSGGNEEKTNLQFARGKWLGRDGRARKPDHVEVSMKSLYSIGFDIHKKMMVYRIKALGSGIIEKGQIDADKKSLGEWIFGLPGRRIAAMEAAEFTISLSPMPSGRVVLDKEARLKPLALHFLHFRFQI